MVWFLLEEHLSVIHTSHVPLVCVPSEPYGSAALAVSSCGTATLVKKESRLGGMGWVFERKERQRWF